jgi:hypothetical protein
VPSYEQLDGGIWVATGFFTAGVSRSVIDKAEQAGFMNARLSDRGRRNSEVFFRHEDARFSMLKGLRQLFEPVSPDVDVEVPNVFECYRYSAGAATESHVDAPSPINGVMSTLTLVVYLNHDFEGGKTIFPDRSLEVQPKAGSALIFEHGLKHAGATVDAGTKYILRTAVAVQL